MDGPNNKKLVFFNFCNTIRKNNSIFKSYKTLSQKLLALGNITKSNEVNFRVHSQLGRNGSLLPLRAMTTETIKIMISEIREHAIFM